MESIGAFAFLEAPLTIVRDVVIPWHASLQRRDEIEPVQTSLSGVRSLIRPIEIPPNRYLFLQTDSEWLALFKNSVSYDPFNPTQQISRLAGCRALAVQWQNQKSKSGRSAETISFSLYGPDTSNWQNLIRCITVSNDSGQLEFSAEGQVQPFETPENYSLPDVRDRFNLEMLDGYCKALGIRLFDDGFYGPEGLLLHVS